MRGLLYYSIAGLVTAAPCSPAHPLPPNPSTRVTFPRRLHQRRLRLQRHTGARTAWTYPGTSCFKNPARLITVPVLRETARGTVVTTTWRPAARTPSFTANSRRPHDRRQRRRHDHLTGLRLRRFPLLRRRRQPSYSKDPGEVRFAFDIDYNGTPGDPSDDVEFPTRSGSCGDPPEQRLLEPATSVREPGGVHEVSRFSTA